MTPATPIAPSRSARSRRIRTALALVALPAAGPAQEPLYLLKSHLPDLQMGFAVAGLGDVDGDGYDDFAVGSADQALGRVRVHSGVDAARLYDLLPVAADQIFGSALDAAGDVDGDGVGDLIVGSRGYAQWSGRALVVSGVDGATLFEFTGGPAVEALGFAVSGAGDLNGDGVPDLVAGAPLTNTPNLGAGAVHAFSGKDGSLLHVVPGSVLSGQLGWSVDAAGDVDGDGHDDFLASERGFVRVYSGADASVLREWSGGFDAWFGHSISSVGDLDGDGLRDLLVGAPLFGAAEAGRVELYSVGTGQLLAKYGGAPGDHLGVAVRGLGDVDGDGLDDLAMAAGWYGASSDYVRVRSGTDQRWLAELSGVSASFGRALASAGDVNGDGLDDLLVGAPEATPTDDGRAYVYLGHRGLVGDPYCTPAVPSSTGLPADLFASGRTKVAKNDLRLTAQHLPLQQLGLVLVGDAQGFVANPGGSQGNLCLAGSLGRFSSQPLQSGASGTFSLVVDLTALPGLGAVQAGETWNFQAWFRDLNPGPTSNFTDAVAVTFN